MEPRQCSTVRNQPIGPSEPAVGGGVDRKPDRVDKFVVRAGDQILRVERVEGNARLVLRKGVS